MAIGDDEFGQCAVPELPEGVKYISAAAGYLHSVLLRDDGAAVAFGSGEKGQCGVPDGWYSQVAAGDFHTVLCTTDDRDPLGPGREWIAFGTTHGLEVQTALLVSIAQKLNRGDCI